MNDVPEVDRQSRKLPGTPTRSSPLLALRAVSKALAALRAMSKALEALRASFKWLPPLVGPIRVRLALLVLVAAVPLLLLAATLAWQNYRLAVGVSAETAMRLRESAIARQDSAVSGAEQMLQALGEGGELLAGDPQTCHQRLAGVLAFQAARYSNIVVETAGGAPHCSAQPVPSGRPRADEMADQALLARANGQDRLVLGPIRVSPLTGRRIIPVAYPIRRRGTLEGYLYAGLRIDWFARAAGAPLPDIPALWLVDSSGQIVQVAATGTSGLPLAPVLARLLASPQVLDAPSAGGQPYAYASTGLRDGYSLIVAYPAAEDRAAALDLLIRRVGQLGLLLLVGLAAVAIGTHLALVEPLSQLSRAVERWRSSGRFEPAVIHHPPTEIRALAATFAEATLAVADHAARHQVSVAQQELLMREIHHRVKNNLQIVASLLNLQASRIRVPEARAEFASARDRVRALATLHRHLYMQGEVHTIDMPGFLVELCSQLFQAMGEVPGQRIQLAIEASPLQMSSDQAVPLSLVVTEAVSNALKYAFPDRRSGHITVRLTSDEHNADLLVEDDGVGIPAGQIDTEAGPRDGLGITLIRGFARQLGATLTVHEEAGTHYSLRMPLNPVADAPSEAA